MKKIIFIVSILFSITSYSQVASGSFIVLNEGAEQDYLNIEELWQVYHQKSVNDGHKNHWRYQKCHTTERGNEFDPYHLSSGGRPKAP